MNILSTLKDHSRFDMPIGDAHRHLWDLNAGRYPAEQDRYASNFFMRAALADRSREDLEKFFH